jgi:hypothetical protein
MSNLIGGSSKPYFTPLEYTLQVTNYIHPQLATAAFTTDAFWVSYGTIPRSGRLPIDSYRQWIEVAMMTSDAIANN